MNFIEKVQFYKKSGELPAKLSQILLKFYISYNIALQKNGHAIEKYDLILQKFLDEVVQQLKKPFSFDLFHISIRSPVDYYQLGLDMLRPLIRFENSTVSGLEHLNTICSQLEQKENVIFFANHQTEPDPQAISLLLENSYPKLAENMIFVAGHRVVSDPLAVPMSLGRNLLCIFSKRYIEYPPEQKPEKQLHNQRTMKRMSQLLAEGGKCIYVAPSGGRDRPGPSGKIEVAPFDPQSIEMFWLMAQQSGQPTHFYPLTLSTYDLLPPPNSITKEIGEGRQTQCTPIHIAFGAEIDMVRYPGAEVKDKRLKRKQRAEYIWSLVKNQYEQIQAQLTDSLRS